MNIKALRQRLALITDVATDGALVVVVAVATALAMATASEPSSREPDAFAYGLGLFIAGLVFFRRRWPVAVLLASGTLSRCTSSSTTRVSSPESLSPPPFTQRQRRAISAGRWRSAACSLEVHSSTGR